MKFTPNYIPHQHPPEFNTGFLMSLSELERLLLIRIWWLADEQLDWAGRNITATSIPKEEALKQVMLMGGPDKAEAALNALLVSGHVVEDLLAETCYLLNWYSAKSDAPRRWYFGYDDGATVTATDPSNPDDRERPLSPRFDLCPKIAPNGLFGWGYSGSGPQRLGIAMLADCLGDEIAELHFMVVVDKIRAFPPDRQWAMRSDDVIRIMEDHFGASGPRTRV